MCIQDRRRVAPLATLAAVAPALMIGLEHSIHGSAFGLSADFWKGVVIGVTLGLQILTVAILIRARVAGPKP